MNLPLHMGLLGVLEAGLIALLVGILSYGLCQLVVRAVEGSMGQALGWACLTAVLVAAGIDTWKLFSLGMMKLESPLYARLALQGIHDPAFLGTRVVVQVVAALTGVALGWLWFSRRWREESATVEQKGTGSGR